MRHLLSTQDLTRPLVEHLIAQAEQLRVMPRLEVRTRLAGVVLATLFYEPSTRTRLSFEAAAARLGAAVIGAENAGENSSAKKGEVLADVFRVVGCYADAIVIRHDDSGAALADAVKLSPVPIVNAGAGAGEHPTQALLDIYTLWREFGRVDRLSLCVVGDLKYGRTVHSLLQLLTQFEDVHVTLVSAPSLALPPASVAALAASGLRVDVTDRFADALANVDAVYQTRVQRERFAGADGAGAQTHALRREHLHLLAPDARILHPLPRVGEIDPAIDDDRRAAYFRQVENGLFARMALLDELLGGVMQ